MMNLGKVKYTTAAEIMAEFERNHPIRSVRSTIGEVKPKRPEIIISTNDIKAYKEMIKDQQLLILTVPIVNERDKRGLFRKASDFIARRNRSFSEEEKDYVIYPITAKAAIQIAAHLNRLPEKLTGGLIEQKAIEGIEKYTGRLIKIIAFGIENNGREPSAKLYEFLERNCTAEILIEGFTKVISQLGMNYYLQCFIMSKGSVIIEDSETKKKSALQYGEDLLCYP